MANTIPTQPNFNEGPNPSLKPRNTYAIPTSTAAAASKEELAIENLSISAAPLPYEQYPHPQQEQYHPYHQQQLQHQHQHADSQHQLPPKQQPPPLAPRPLQQNFGGALKSNPKTLTTITATITTNNDQIRSISFEEAQRMKQKNNQRSTQLPPAIAAKVLTPAQQREAEADAYIQRAIELHESNDLEQATYYFRLAAQGENPVGQLMYGLSLRHGWGCKPNPKDAIFYLQRAAEYAMSELKELSPGNRENIQAIQRHATRHQRKHGESSQPLKRMDADQRKSATISARKELVLALYELGMSFLNGWGVSKDKAVAFNYFKLAADLGDPDSQNETAQCYLEGTGTEKNSFEAARYYRLASAQGASQLGNSWIWKPKYDQYCEQQAAAAAAASAARKMEQQGVGAGLVTPTSPNTPSSAIALGIASMTASAMVTPSAIGHSSLASSVPGHQQGKQHQPPTGSPARQGRYTLAGDLISSSQLELKVKQAEQLTQSTVKPLFTGSGKGQGQEPAGKKKHRWSLWGHNLHRRAPSSG